MIRELNTNEEFDAAILSEKLTIVNASSQGCGPCRMIAPGYKAESALPENADIQFLKFDIDEHEDLGEKLGIQMIPMFIFYKNGKEIDRIQTSNHENLKKKIAEVRG